MSYRAFCLVPLAALLSCSAPGFVSSSASGSATASVGVKSPSGGQPENTSPAVNAIRGSSHPGIEACAKGDVEGTLAIGRAFEDSMHELVVCGGIAASFAVSFLDLFVNLARKISGKPGSIEHIGNGRYKVGNVMHMVTTLPFKTSFGDVGDPIPFDIFDASNYFTNATIKLKAKATMSLSTKQQKVEPSEVELVFAFDEARPGLELLGAVNAQGELSMRFDAMIERFSDIGVTQEILVDDDRGSAKVTYEAMSSAVPIRNLAFAAGGAGIDIKSASVTDSSRGQTLTVTDWAMAFSGGSAGTMDGKVTFEVRGGDFDWGGTFVYPHRKSPDVTITCL